MVTTESSSAGASVSPNDRRVIKRYSNRKLYDTKDSRYVTLLQIADMVREGEEVQIIDNATKEDKTDVTLALIISEELKARPRGIPLATLKFLIRQRGEKILSQLREGPIGRLIPRDESEAESAESAAEEPPEVEREVSEKHDKDAAPKGFRATLEQFQHSIDERIRASLPNFSAFSELQAEVRKLAARLESLEKRLGSGPESKE